MTKPLFQDIVPPDKRSIKHVPIPNRTRRTEYERISVHDKVQRSAPAVSVRHLNVPDDENPRNNIVQESEPQHIRPRSTPPPPPPPSQYTRSVEQDAPLRRIPFYEEDQPYRRRFPWKAAIILVCAIIIIIGTYFVLSHFAKAVVTVTPKIENITVNTQLTGLLEQNATSTATESSSTVAASANLSSEDVPYRIISITKDGAMSVAASGKTTVASKATGKITIFNNYSTSPQKLIANTRFATPSGLIYRISSPISIPGKKGATPGSITVTVTADKAGSQYNIGLSDFVVPGLSGTRAYADIYARSQTTMTGGFSGIEPKIDSATLAATQATIDAELKGVLLQQSQQQVLPGEILLPNAYIIDYTHLPSTQDATSSQAIVHDEGTIHAFVFKTAAMAQALNVAAASSTSTSTSGITWNINDASGLNFAFTIPSNTVSQPWNVSSLPFKISGSTTLVATIDTQKIKENLVNKPKNDFGPILNSFPSIVTATMSIQPFWKQNFPANPQNITVSVNQP